jgi:predicted transcriptional regulator YheO
MKISQMIIDLASDYIELGSTLESKQNHLNVVCIAWNISILPERNRKMALTHFLANYKKNNPDNDEDNMKNIQHDMELLIEEMIRRFPNAVTPIEHAKITENDTEYSIVVASLPITKQLLPPAYLASSNIIKH